MTQEVENYRSIAKAIGQDVFEAITQTWPNYVDIAIKEYRKEDAEFHLVYTQKKFAEIFPAKYKALMIATIRNTIKNRGNI